MSFMWRKSRHSLLLEKVYMRCDMYWYSDYLLLSERKKNNFRQVCTSMAKFQFHIYVHSVDVLKSKLYREVPIV